MVYAHSTTFRPGFIILRISINKLSVTNWSILCRRYDTRIVYSRFFSRTF